MPKSSRLFDHTILTLFWQNSKAMVLWQPPALKQKGHGHDAKNAGPKPSGVEKRNSGGSFDDSFDDPLMDSDSRFQESDGTAPIARKSAYREAAEVIATLVRAGVSCLCFVTARALTESVVRDVKHLLVKSGDQVRPWAFPKSKHCLPVFRP